MLMEDLDDIEQEVCYICKKTIQKEDSTKIGTIILCLRCSGK